MSGHVHLMKDVVLEWFQRGDIRWEHVPALQCACGYTALTDHTLRLMRRAERQAREATEQPRTS